MWADILQRRITAEKGNGSSHIWIGQGVRLQSATLRPPIHHRHFESEGWKRDRERGHFSQILFHFPSVALRDAPELCWPCGNGFTRVDTHGRWWEGRPGDDEPFGGDSFQDLPSPSAFQPNTRQLWGSEVPSLLQRLEGPLTNESSPSFRHDIFSQRRREKKSPWFSWNRWHADQSRWTGDRKDVKGRSKKAIECWEDWCMVEKGSEPSTSTCQEHAPSSSLGFTNILKVRTTVPSVHSPFQVEFKLPYYATKCW